MKPVAIFQFAPDDRPAYFVTHLHARAVPYRLLRIDLGESVPGDPAAFAGVAMLGGPMSANDPLPWIGPMLEFTRQAVRTDIPVIGHCLGGQLMTRALGGSVSVNPLKEIGWSMVQVEHNPVASDWFGAVARFEALQWHVETFTVPPGAIRIATGPYCANQVYALGPHLAMQCHVEVDAATVQTWCEHGVEEIAANAGPAVQSVGDILDHADERCAALHRISARLYDRWLDRLRG